MRGSSLSWRAEAGLSLWEPLPLGVCLPRSKVPFRPSRADLTWSKDSLPMLKACLWVSQAGLLLLDRSFEAWRRSLPLAKRASKAASHSATLRRRSASSAANRSSWASRCWSHWRWRCSRAWRLCSISSRQVSRAAEKSEMEGRSPTQSAS
eukprot:CAMPEP_0175251216 /NCGR_PEP_ID=MMETSP0093-20121207/35552_1 /TAXON_ID=311494 /ORGANISM="Alexandrium monilatum, Strain CCMP3105" /LENGTH=150 /DNA_ID=CAMNT_0016545481 /DNA_START=225 /DNA_END=677 /DNA_ORIENTATION=+